MTNASSTLVDELRPVLKTLSAESSSLLSAVQSALPRDSDMFDTPQGPSLLTLKNATLLNYLHHLVLLSAARLRGRSMASDDDAAGSGLVRNLIELRLVLEKVRPVEGRMRGLVERLVRTADEEEKRVREGRLDDDGGGGGGATASAAGTEEVDPLVFRPNVAALSAAADASDSKKQRGSRSRGRDDSDNENGVYRPPRLAPVAYNPETVAAPSGGRGSKKERVAPRNSALLSDLSASMSANPYEVSSGGVGVGGSGGGSASARAKALSRMQDYEEANFTRLTMSKKDAKRRRRDEADVALGGAGMSNKRGRVGAGLEEEFGDLLRNRSSSSDVRGAKRSSALQRSRSASGGAGDDILGSEGAGGGTFQRKVRNDNNRRSSGGKGKRR